MTARDLRGMQLGGETADGAGRDRKAQTMGPSAEGVVYDRVLSLTEHWACFDNLFTKKN